MPSGLETEYHFKVDDHLSARVHFHFIDHPELDGRGGGLALRSCVELVPHLHHQILLFLQSLAFGSMTSEGTLLSCSRLIN